MERGEKTTHPGLYRTSIGFVVRVLSRGSVKKEYAKTLRGVTEEQALVWLHKLQRQADLSAENEKAGTSTTTLTAYARSWVRELREQRDRGELKPRTVEAHVWNLERFVLPLLGEEDVTSLTRKTIKNWMQDIQTLKTPAMRKGRGKKMYKQESRPYAKATLKSGWRTCHLLMSWLTV
jgi:hypothetical protein